MDPMSIASMSTSMANSQALSAVGTAVMSMALDTAKTQASGEVAMLNSMPGPALEKSVNPAVGGKIDVSV